VTKRKPKPDDEMLVAARAGIKAVLDDPEATISERLKAIDAGLKLLIVQNKLKGIDDDGESFFPSQ
jgi:hypothetical protein